MQKIIFIFLLLQCNLRNFEQHNNAFAAATKTTTTTVTAAAAVPQIADKDFQINLLNDVSAAVEAKAQKVLNEFLQTLQQDEQYAAYENELLTMQLPAADAEQKIVFVKQILDVNNRQAKAVSAAAQSATLTTEHVQQQQQQQQQQHAEKHNANYFYVLRNLNFLKNLQQQLQAMHERSVRQLQQLRMHRVCKQFQQKPPTTAHKYPPPYPTETKLVPIVELTRAQMHAQQNVTIDLHDFGRQLYAAVQTVGAEIIDGYLVTVRKLLKEVLAEHTPQERAQELQTLMRVLREIETTLQTRDLYAKRQLIYAYIRGNLTQDYEQLRDTHTNATEQHLTEILLKLKERGLDLMLTFIFSNFEFLEHTYAAWSKLLPARVKHANYIGDTQLLYDVLLHYERLKLDTENLEKYETYVQQVKVLHDKTANGTDNDAHIYELLYSASQTVGSVTLNMIKAKCENV